MIHVAADMPPRALMGLGADSAPLAAVSKIAKGFPRCFTSRSILPAIARARAFANTVSTEGLSIFSGGASPTTKKKDLARAVGNLDYWYNRLSTEPVTVYCSNLTKQVTGGAKVSATDWQQVLNAILEPYAQAYSIEGAAAVVTAAGNDLLGDLSLGLYNATLGLVIPPWVKWGGLGLGVIVALGLFQRVRGPKRKVVTVVTPERTVDRCPDGFTRREDADGNWTCAPDRPRKAADCGCSYGDDA